MVCGGCPEQAPPHSTSLLPLISAVHTHVSYQSGATLHCVCCSSDPAINAAYQGVPMTGCRLGVYRYCQSGMDQVLERDIEFNSSMYVRVLLKAQHHSWSDAFCPCITQSYVRVYPCTSHSATPPPSITDLFTTTTPNLISTTCYSLLSALLLPSPPLPSPPTRGHTLLSTALCPGHGPNAAQDALWCRQHPGRG